MSTTMTTLLKTLGDDWHNPHPYVRLVQSVLPDVSFQQAKAIEDKLLQVYEDEHFDFKSLKSTKPFQTTYESEIEIADAKKKLLEDEMKKEEERFNKLIEKFKELEAPETSSEEQKQEEDEEEEEEEEEDEEAAQAKKRGKGQMACRRTLKAEANRKKGLAQGIKASMASSQAKLMELSEEAEKLTKLSEYYAHYNNATKYYLKSMRKLTQEYSETKSVEALIRGIQDTLSYYDMMMRRYVPTEPCCGKEKSLCETHLLPLCVTVYPNDNYRHVWKCAASP